jgi:membrane protein YdbS with pleckstrin-like domain
MSTSMGQAGVVELRPPLNLVNKRSIAYWAVRAGVGWAVVAAIQVVIMATAGVGAGNVIAIAVTGALAAAHLSVMPIWRYRVHRWEITPDVVYTQSGWFNRERRIAPVSRIQTVDTQRGPIEQLFGLSNVTVTTASARGPVHIHGLDNDTAQRLAAELATRTQATTGDAT